MALGHKYLSAILDSKYSKDLFRLDETFFTASEVPVFEYILNHFKSYGKLPEPETLVHDLGNLLETAVEPSGYYLDKLINRRLHNGIKDTLIETKDLLTNEDVPEQEVLSVLLNKSIELSNYSQKLGVVDFRDAPQIMYELYMKAKSVDGEGSLKFGWSTIDDMTGGLGSGDVASIVGRPASGKTFQMLKIAENHWKSGGVPLFVSMEMTINAITQRLSAMNVHLPLTKILRGELSTKSMNKMFKDLEQVKEHQSPFWIVDGNLTATVDDIIMYCYQLKPSAIIIDGGYLLRHPNQRLGRFDRITENAELLKQRVATDLQVPVCVSYQLSREVTKKKKDQKAGIEDIYGSDAIGQLSSVVMGLFEYESIEAQRRRKIDILKGRNGEVGQFLINWDFNKMMFNEIPTILTADGILVEDAKGLQFL